MFNFLGYNGDEGGIIRFVFFAGWLVVGVRPTSHLFDATGIRGFLAGARNDKRGV